MFELNPNLEIIEEPFEDSKLYTIHNFLKDPDEALNFIKTAPHTMWKEFENPKHNGLHYVYKKIFHLHENIQPVYELMKPYFIDSYLQFQGFVINWLYLYKNSYNDYENNYFWPHKDAGWTGVVFLDDYEGPGTNLYNKIARDVRDDTIVPNSQGAWRPKERYQLIKTIPAKYNTCVFFEGEKYNHNVAIVDDTYFEKPRYNLVIHFCHDKLKRMNDRVV